MKHLLSVVLISAFSLFAFESKAQLPPTDDPSVTWMSSGNYVMGLHFEGTVVGHGVVYATFEVTIQQFGHRVTVERTEAMTYDYTDAFGDEYHYTSHSGEYPPGTLVSWAFIDVTQ